MLYALVNMSGQHPPMRLDEALASVGLLVPADARHDLPPCYARVDGGGRGGGGQAPVTAAEAIRSAAARLGYVRGFSGTDASLRTTEDSHSNHFSSIRVAPRPKRAKYIDPPKGHAASLAPFTLPQGANDHHYERHCSYSQPRQLYHSSSALQSPLLSTGDISDKSSCTYSSRHQDSSEQMKEGQGHNNWERQEAVITGEQQGPDQDEPRESFFPSCTVLVNECPQNFAPGVGGQGLKTRSGCADPAPSEQAAFSYPQTSDLTDDAGITDIDWWCDSVLDTMDLQQAGRLVLGNEFCLDFKV